MFNTFAGSRSQSNPGGPLRRPKVVIIEDDERLREMLAVSLRMHGYFVRTAGDGLMGLRVLEVVDADVVVLDLRLPLASGFEVLHELRTWERTRRMPVIAISGSEDGIRQAQTNPDVFTTLPKPFLTEDLVSAVVRATKGAAGAS
jgi:two-component system OmpR family response regulator